MRLFDIEGKGEYNAPPIAKIVFCEAGGLVYNIFVVFNNKLRKTERQGVKVAGLCDKVDNDVVQLFANDNTVVINTRW